MHSNGAFCLRKQCLVKRVPGSFIKMKENSWDCLPVSPKIVLNEIQFYVFSYV